MFHVIRVEIFQENRQKTHIDKFRDQKFVPQGPFYTHLKVPTDKQKEMFLELLGSYKQARRYWNCSIKWAKQSTFQGCGQEGNLI